MTKLDREEVQKVAHLARLELTKSEEEAFSKQLNDILEYFEQLQELNTDNVQPTIHAIEMRNVMRTDKREDYPQRDEILQVAPEQEGEFFKVPKIL
ncbi:MAG: Asp-tRNA(Asn)/Glu-tRNA(Gln) amidotransferase subunit GatC [Cyanobacteria bacterium SID2]|nr:Asp-tRNA(Asn)/Glu-tRNA(Gln) amidotransferase subunit GatC [Cyanobacteria bacterium SID2]MBP0002753.1 Asp-tRNA(Asn)/Glu-tRNA(Gln) amidotransferase subunit GatC [Cyanobacteria bacterium SBC]